MTVWRRTPSRTGIMTSSSLKIGFVGAVGCAGVCCAAAEIANRNGRTNCLSDDGSTDPPIFNVRLRTEDDGEVYQSSDCPRREICEILSIGKNYTIASKSLKAAEIYFQET